MSDILTFAKAEFFQLLPERLILASPAGFRKPSRMTLLDCWARGASGPALFYNVTNLRSR